MHKSWGIQVLAPIYFRSHACHVRLFPPGFASWRCPSQRARQVDSNARTPQCLDSHGRSVGFFPAPKKWGYPAGWFNPWKSDGKIPIKVDDDWVPPIDGNPYLHGYLRDLSGCVSEIQSRNPTWPETPRSFEDFRLRVNVGYFGKPQYVKNMKKPPI